MQFLVPLDSRKSHGLPTGMLRALGKSGGGAPGGAGRWDQLTWVLRWVAGAQGALCLFPHPQHTPLHCLISALSLLKLTLSSDFVPWRPPRPSQGLL